MKITLIRPTPWARPIVASFGLSVAFLAIGCDKSKLHPDEKVLVSDSLKNSRLDSVRVSQDREKAS